MNLNIQSKEAAPGSRRLPPVGSTNLDEQIYDRIKVMIAEGLLLPGERIVPDQLARALGVSRTPILTALKRLSQSQVVEWRSRHGVFVRHLSRRELAMTYEVREVLEGLSARRTALVITREQVQYFRDLLGSVDPEDTLEGRRSYMRRDYLFHSGLLEIAGSPPLIQTLNALNILVSAFSGSGILRPIRESMAEHGKILDALERRDPEGAEAAMRDHFRPTVQLLHQHADLIEQSGAG